MIKNELQADFTQFQTEKKNELHLEGPEWEFVCKESWDEKLDGKYDPSKRTLHECFGTMREGIWVLRGREGVFRHKASASVGTREVHVLATEKGGQASCHQRLLEGI